MQKQIYYHLGKISVIIVWCALFASAGAASQDLQNEFNQAVDNITMAANPQERHLTIMSNFQFFGPKYFELLDNKHACYLAVVALFC